ncbi:MAG: hypothetical protein ACOX8S_00405 [Christensenellales bacterium]|jgi:rhamnogalacturonyl hydrolase YesR
MSRNLIDQNRLMRAVDAACQWLTDVAQHNEETPPPCPRAPRMFHKTWKGSFKGEYSAATRTWDYFCPIWHGGQAVKALCMAYRVTGNEKYLTHAKWGADFILRERFSDPDHPHYGLIWAVEDYDDCINTSAVLECLDGIFALYEVTKDEALKEAFLAACNWVASNAYLGEGLFLDNFSLISLSFEHPHWQDRFVPAEGHAKHDGRPLLDDAIFLKAYKLSGDTRYRDIFYATADHLLAQEMPAGTWINYPPCGGIRGSIHPRQSFWWGLPMLDAYVDSGNKAYLDCLKRCADWYLNAQRSDGGHFRLTYADFKTSSFGHATSGGACAAILWQRLYELKEEEIWLEAAARSLGFAMDVQFTKAEDPNLKGAILEKVMPPENSDASPYYLRDLGSIFFIQAACIYLEGEKAKKRREEKGA